MLDNEPYLEFSVSAYHNRFELLLANLHFVNNEDIEPNNRLGTILTTCIHTNKQFSKSPFIKPRYCSRLNNGSLEGKTNI
jgi:hypothetical protein